MLLNSVRVWISALICLGTASISSPVAYGNCSKHFITAADGVAQGSSAELIRLIRKANALGIKEHVTILGLSESKRIEVLSRMIAQFNRQAPLIQQLLPQQGAVIDLIRESVAEHPLTHPKRNERPRGYPIGATYYDCPGASVEKCSIVAISDWGDNGYVATFHHEQGHTYEEVFAKLYPDFFGELLPISHSPRFEELHRATEWPDPYYEELEEGFAYGWENYFGSPHRQARLKSDYPRVFAFFEAYEMILQKQFDRYKGVNPVGPGGIEFLRANVEFLIPGISLKKLDEIQSRKIEIEKKMTEIIRAGPTASLSRRSRKARAIFDLIDDLAGADVSDDRSEIQLLGLIRRETDVFLYGDRGIYRKLVDFVTSPGRVDLATRSAALLRGWVDLVLYKMRVEASSLAPHLDGFLATILEKLAEIDPRAMAEACRDEIEKTRLGQDFKLDMRSKRLRFGFRLALGYVGITDSSTLSVFAASAIADEDFDSIIKALQKMGNQASRQILVTAAVRIFLNKKVYAGFTDRLVKLNHLPDFQAGAVDILGQIFETLWRLPEADQTRVSELRAQLSVYYDEDVPRLPDYLQAFVRDEILESMGDPGR